MALPTPKELLKLAKACRKAGIYHFKSAEFEFTLTEEASKPSVSKAKANKVPEGTPVIDQEYQTDIPNEEQLLYWSVNFPEGSPLEDPNSA